MGQLKKPSGEPKSAARPNVQRQTLNNNNVTKDTHDCVLFGSIAEHFCDWEIAFLIHHMNKAKTFGIKINLQTIKFMAIETIREFIETINVGSIGQSVVGCILSKLATNTKHP
jgi:hypothetical protein